MATKIPGLEITVGSEPERISESLIIGYDSSNGTDISALSVVRFNGTKRTMLNTFFGEEADLMYDRLTRDKTGRVTKL